MFGLSPSQNSPIDAAFRQDRGMAEELWRPSLDLALHRNRHVIAARFVQLATIRENGRPAVRTLVFRGFVGDSHRLIFATDSRSGKADELEKSPWAEACWYFPITREQFRFQGIAKIVGADSREPGFIEARLSIWREMSEEARLAYTWPDPGQLRVPLAAYPSQSPDPVEPLPHFCLLVLEITGVDHLELNGNPQHRWKYSSDQQGRWTGVEINP